MVTKCIGAMVLRLVNVPWSYILSHTNALISPHTFLSQIISPYDKHIQESIMANLVPWKESRDTSVLSESNRKYVDPLDEVRKEYFSHVKNAVVTPSANLNSPLKFTYTAMHGVGYKYVAEAFKIAGFKVKLSK